jgi:glycolate oxidase FAD binding subunit
MVAHAGNGVLYVYLEDAGLERLRAVLGAARAAGTYAVVEHSPDALRGQLESVDVWGPTRSDFPLMKALKQQFDPAGTLNPGRFVGGI